ncbi:hypothetical protein INT47_011303 [Mucor saturninus]|uniref:Uncharacterized protein n=1 Tax=Mucor saturninus TaxID=64648 RepID=A0A8H7RLH8_9FUNG|nr:hypothetical protein INT47_011303 [Mucor saturninus]
MLNVSRLEKGLKEALDIDFVEGDVELLVLLDFVIFMERLAEEAEKEMVKSNRRKTFSQRPRQETTDSVVVRKIHVDNCVERVLREFRG